MQHPAPELGDIPPAPNTPAPISPADRGPAVLEADTNELDDSAYEREVARRLTEYLDQHPEEVRHSLRYSSTSNAPLL